MEGDELVDVEVVWTTKMKAYSVQEAADKAQDILRSRVPLVFFVGCADNNYRIAPRLEECVEDTLKRWFPSCDVEFTDYGEYLEVDVISNHFRDIPEDAERESLVTSIFSSLPQEELDSIYFGCFTREEWDEACLNEECGDDEETDTENLPQNVISSEDLDKAAMNFVVDRLTSVKGWTVKSIERKMSSDLSRHTTDELLDFRLVRIHLTTTQGEEHTVNVRVDEENGEVFEYSIDDGPVADAQELLTCAYQS